MWLSLRAMSRASSAANSRRICSSALGGTIRSAVEPPCARDVHLGESVPVGRHHAHVVGPELPQYAVQNRPTLLRRGREGDVPHQLVHHTRRRVPRPVELDGGEGRKLLTRQTEQLELRAAAFDCHARLTRGREPHGPRGQLPRDIHELLGRQGHRALGVHLGRHGGRDRDVQVRPESRRPCLSLRPGRWRAPAGSSWRGSPPRLRSIPPAAALA